MTRMCWDVTPQTIRCERCGDDVSQIVLVMSSDAGTYMALCRICDDLAARANIHPYRKRVVDE